MNAPEALMRLGASTAEAVAKALDAICPAPVQRGDVGVVPGEESPFAGFPFERGAVAVSVHYVDGVTGGNVLLMTPACARAIAAAMGGEAPPADADAALTELELSAVAEAANQMFAAAASATGVVLGQDVEIAPPDTRLLDGPAAAVEAFDATPHAVSATFQACGEPCRLVQLVPNAFVVRMTRALDEQGTEQLSGNAGLSALGIAGRAVPGEERALDDALRDIRVRVWAELGRTRVSLGAAPELPPGAVLELDRKADDPVDLYVNGLRFASGRLVLTEEGEWALRLEEVAGRTQSTEGALI
ncbi:MAG: FliM/FliN family flagellar motor switch protein [Actinobacteria bacterium]|nr:FliM/FliN family flagellar motor switch protein [Actinomycetota bacterium]